MLEYNLPISTKVNTREAERSCKLKDNVGLRTREYQVALNNFRLEIKRSFLMLWSGQSTRGSKEGKKTHIYICKTQLVYKSV